MKIKSFFRLFSASTDGETGGAEAVEYQGYMIRPEPHEQSGQFYTAGVISKQFPEGTREQHFIRADTHTSRDSAAEHAVLKARQIIDEQGDRLFRDD